MIKLSTSHNGNNQLFKKAFKGKLTAVVLLFMTASAFYNSTGRVVLCTKSDMMYQDSLLGMLSERRFGPELQRLYQYEKPEPRTKRVHWLADDECGQRPNFEKYFTQDNEQRSRLNEDKIIYDMFFKKNVTNTQEEMERFKYIELGAFNGMTESNTRFFDVCLGWEGLLIEPNPRQYFQLVKNRPHSHRVSYAASCSEEDSRANKTVTFHAVAFTNAAQTDVTSAYSNPEKMVPVPCGPLTPLIEDLMDGHVHFMSLDVENAEHFVLQNVDFRKIQIDLMIVENKNSFCTEVCESRDKSRDILQQNGYKLYPGRIRHSDLFVHMNATIA